MDYPGFVSQPGQDIFLFITTRRPTLGPNGSPVVLSQGLKLQGREITTYLYVTLGLKMSGAVPPFPLCLHFFCI